MNINSISASVITTNSINQTAQIQKNSEWKDETVIQNRNGWVSESDKRIQVLDEKYRRIDEQNKRFKNPEQHIFDKYSNQNSTFFRHDMTEMERGIALRNEICWLHNGLLGHYDMRDALFRNEPPIHSGVEVAEFKAFNRQKVNDQLKQLLGKYQINIPDSMKLTFTIDPNNYKLTVSGTDDTELTALLEKALNSAGNSKALFVHIIRLCQSATKKVPYMTLVKKKVMELGKQSGSPNGKKGCLARVTK